MDHNDCARVRDYLHAGAFRRRRWGWHASVRVLCQPPAQHPQQKDRYICSCVDTRERKQLSNNVCAHVEFPSNRRRQRQRGRGSTVWRTASFRHCVCVVVQATRLGISCAMNAEYSIQYTIHTLSLCVRSGIYQVQGTSTQHETHTHNQHVVVSVSLCLSGVFILLFFLSSARPISCCTF